MKKIFLESKEDSVVKAVLSLEKVEGGTEIKVEETAERTRNTAINFYDETWNESLLEFFFVIKVNAFLNNGYKITGL